MHSARNRSVGDLAAGQLGLLTRTQVLARGYTPSGIQRERDSGRWQTVSRGLYLVRGAPWTWHTQLLARCLDSDGVASHRSAAALLDVGGFRQGPPEITVRPGTKAQGEGSRVHESGDFELIRPVKIGAIPTTPAARLAVDLGAVVHYARYESTIDELMGRGELTWSLLHKQLELHSAKGRNGVGSLRRYLEDPGGPLAEGTPLEVRFLRGLRRWGLPDPTAQLTVNDPYGTFLARVDAAYEDERIIFELDSRRWHLNRRSQTKDPTVRRALRMLGWFVMEITSDMLRDHEAKTFADIAALRAKRAPRPLT